MRQLSFLLIAALCLSATLISSVLSASCYATLDIKDVFASSLNLRSGKSGSVVQGWQIKNGYTDLDFDGLSIPSVRLIPQGGCTAAVVKAFTDVKDMRMYVTIRKNQLGKYVVAKNYGDAEEEIDADILSKIADSEVASSVSIYPAENVIYLANLQCSKTDKKIVKFTFPRVITPDHVTLRWDILEDTKGPSDCSVLKDDNGQTSSATAVIAGVQMMMVALFGSTSGLWVMTVILTIFVGCLVITSCALCCMVGCKKNKSANTYNSMQTQQSHGTIPVVPYAQPQPQQPQQAVTGYYGTVETQPIYPSVRSNATL